MYRRLDTNATAKSAELEHMLDQVDVSAQIPTCIPRQGWAMFLRATPDVQRQMVRTARQPSLIEVPELPRRESEFNRRTGKGLCYCRELERCPLAPTVDIRNYYKDFTGRVSQYYPNDQGWWQMRDLTNQLVEYAREHNLIPQVRIADTKFRAEHLDAKKAP